MKSLLTLIFLIPTSWKIMCHCQAAGVKHPSMIAHLFCRTNRSNGEFWRILKWKTACKNPGNEQEVVCCGQLIRCDEPGEQSFPAKSSWHILQMLFARYRWKTRFRTSLKSAEFFHRMIPKTIFYPAFAGKLPGIRIRSAVGYCVVLQGTRDSYVILVNNVNTTLPAITLPSCPAVLAPIACINK